MNIACTEHHCCSEPKCQCIPNNYGTKTMWRADCSRRELSSTPHFISNVVDIDLSHNDIASFPKRGQLPSGLINLDFSSNSLSVFPNESFENLHNLERISLADTKEELNDKILFPGIFVGLARLKVLNLTNVRGKSGNYPIALTDLTALETLIINGRIHGFGPEYQALTKLTSLDISGNNGNCTIHSFHEGYFQYVSTLTSLDVSKCRLKNILLNTFSELHQLQVLDISYNEELSFGIFRNLSNDLNYTNIQILKMNKIHCTFGLGTEIYVSDIIAMQNTSIRRFEINSNRVALLEDQVLRYLPKSLEHISARDNRFTMGIYALESDSLINLKTFDMSLQYTSHDPRDMFRTCDDTQNGRLARNKLRMRNLIPSMSSKNESKIHQQNDIDSPHISIPLPIRLETGYFNSSTLQYAIAHNILGENNIKHVYAQDNVFYNLIGPLENVESIEAFDLSNNFCTHISNYFFDYFTGLKHLKMNHNILGFVLQQDVNGEIFKNLHNLTNIELSYNRIQSLPDSIFKHLVSLENVMLRSNLLREFNMRIDHMRNLKIIDLSLNQLSEIPKKLREQISRISQHHEVIVNLTGNPIGCNCENVDFIRWIVQTKVVVRFGQNDTCQTKFSTSNHFRMDKTSELLLLLESKCRSYTVLIVIMLCLLVSMVCITACGLVYRYRWKLRYLYYMTKSRYKGYSTVDNKTREDVYEFDAFVSYADEDRQFALHEILEKVEKASDLKLCFHSRDFIPGFDIAENITNAIHNSRKTVCILSPNYVKSYWCMFELNIGRMESIYSRNGDDVLFLVFYHHVSTSDLPLPVIDLINDKSYIEYPDDPHGNVVFWRKLQETITWS